MIDQIALAKNTLFRSRVCGMRFECEGVSEEDLGGL